MTPQKSSVRLDPSLELLVERLAGLDSACVVATVISATGSTYSKPGTRMLIEADGRITGLLSGGCLEHDLREHAKAVLATGAARRVTYDMRADNDLVFGMGAGCEGCMGILLEHAGPDSGVRRALSSAYDTSRRSLSAVLVTRYTTSTEQLGTSVWIDADNRVSIDALDTACAQALDLGAAQAFHWTADGGTQSAWLQPVLPLPAILICGAGPDTVPLVAALRALHFPVTVTDHRPAYARAEQFPGAVVRMGPADTLDARMDLNSFFAAVVMSHHLPSDAHYLRALAKSDLGYIGVLGPRGRRQRLLSALGNAASGLEKRLRGPIGLNIGAVRPEGIALAIAAEIHAVAARHDAQAVRQSLSFEGRSATSEDLRTGAEA